jgi:soluble lytic murein transglycosylase-like protein
MCGVAATILQGAGGAAVSVVRTDPRTGRLVRAVVREHAAAQPVTPRVPSAGLVETVDRIAQQNQLSASLVHSVIQVESNYDPNAISPKGALGLMQLIPSTARRFGVSDVFDPADNIQGGARYLKYLLGLYKGDEALALAAYNAGEGAVSRYGGMPPYPETQDYVAKVRRRLAGKAAETAASLSAVQTNDADAKEIAAETVPAYNPIHVVTGANGKVYYTSH